MKKVVLSVVAALALSATSAIAADMPAKAAKMAPAPATPWFDIAVGGLVQSDYNFRGVSQSNRGPSGGAYFEPDFTTPIGTLYVGVAAWAIDWPSAIGFTAPSAEVDFYGGWRNSWGPLSLDIGLIYYYYPREVFNGATSQSDFYEIYGKAAYEVVKNLTIGTNVFYTPDLLHYSSTFSGLVPGFSQKADAVYASVTGKWITPWTFHDIGSYLSGELGHWWINGSGFTNAAVVAAGGFPGINPSYTYWNAGLAFTYKAITLDLRYYGDDMSVAKCASFLATTVGNASNNWCNDTFIVALKFDTTLNALK